MSGVPVLATSESAQDVSPRIGIEKRCSKCKKIKLLTEFSTNGNRYKSACKLCRNAMPVDRAKSNESTRRWRENHIDRARELAKKNRVKRREKCRAELSIWRAKNPDKVRILQQRSLKVRMSKPIFKLDASIRGRIWKALRDSKGGRSWKFLVGFTLDDLKRHLEGLFQPGMSWENYGEWHLDHIRPVCSFKFAKPEDEDFKKCWSLDNLQPLWAIDNWQKGGRWSNN